MNWVESLNRAVDYIEEHLSEDLKCGDVAGHVYLSVAHFQRAFRLMTGMAAGEYIRCRRLTLAGNELTRAGVKVIDVALKYGYETSESFSKAFGRFHGVTPMEAKREGTNLKSLSRLTIKIIMEGAIIMEYRIVKEKAFDVAVKARTFGDEQDSTRDVPMFWDEYFAAGLEKKVTPVYGICAPHAEGGGNWQYGIGGPISGTDKIPGGFEVWTIPAGTWAVFKCVGAMPNAIQDMWKRIYSEWLPQAKYEMTPSYDLEKYTDGDLSSADYISEIWIPVKEKV
jgi:AraC family transcriptional regulator